MKQQLQTEAPDRETIHFQPDDLSKRLLKRVIGEKPRRGVKSKFLNKCIQQYLKPYAGKVERAMFKEMEKQGT